jgi:hypothetical protein
MTEVDLLTDQQILTKYFLGTMDTAAYMQPEDFDALIDEHHWSLVEIRDKRYDCVIHLVTAAIGTLQLCYS